MKQTDKIYYGSLTNLNDTFAIHPVIFCPFKKSEITFKEKFLSLPVSESCLGLSYCLEHLRFCLLGSAIFLSIITMNFHCCQLCWWWLCFIMVIKMSWIISIMWTWNKYFLCLIEKWKLYHLHSPKIFDFNMFTFNWISNWFVFDT